MKRWKLSGVFVVMCLALGFAWWALETEPSSVLPEEMISTVLAVLFVMSGIASVILWTRGRLLLSLTSMAPFYFLPYLFIGMIAGPRPSGRVIEISGPYELMTDPQPMPGKPTMGYALQSEYGSLNPYDWDVCLVEEMGLYRRGDRVQMLSSRVRSPWMYRRELLVCGFAPHAVARGMDPRALQLRKR